MNDCTLNESNGKNGTMTNYLERTNDSILNESNGTSGFTTKGNAMDDFESQSKYMNEIERADDLIKPKISGKNDNALNGFERQDKCFNESNEIERA